MGNNFWRQYYCFRSGDRAVRNSFGYINLVSNIYSLYNRFNSGSGIYSRNSVLATFYNPVLFSPQNKMLIADMPKALPIRPLGTTLMRPFTSPYKHVPMEDLATKSNDVIIVPGETQRITVNNQYIQCCFEYTTR